MKQNTRYALLYNQQLWQAKPEIICQIDAELQVGINWDNMVDNINMKHNTVREIMQDGIASLLSKLGAQVKEPAKSDKTKTKDKNSPALFKAQPHKVQNIEQNVVQNIEKNIVESWDASMHNATTCTKCRLCERRNYVVVERGNREAPWMFVGEAPLDADDKSGTPFVGASGELLDKMIAAMKLDVDRDVYICNAIKCIVPDNCNPEPIEIESCRQHLLSQIALVKPKIIIALGRFASQALLDTDLAVAKLRGSVKFCNNIPVIVTYPPAYLLRNIEAKKDAWADLQFAMQVFKGL